MPIPYQPLCVRLTQTGWVLDAYQVKEAILPISIIFDPAELYQPGFCFNNKRVEIKAMFEKELSEIYKYNQEPKS